MALEKARARGAIRGVALAARGADGAARDIVLAASVLATIGLAAVGTIYGALTGAARARETLLPMLVLPIVIPVLIAGVRCWQAASVASGPRFGVWLSVLGAFAVIYVAAGVVLYGQIEEVQ